MHCSTPACGARSPTAARSRCGPMWTGPRPRSPRSRRPTWRATWRTRRCSSGSGARCAPAPRDTWVGDSPDRAELAELLADDPEALEVLLDRSIADVVEQHVRRRAAAGAAARAGRDRHLGRPARPGHRRRACDARHGHAGRRPLGLRARRNGRVSFALADAAVEHGAVLATGVEVGAIEPGDGVRLAGGELIRASVVVSNADPKRTTALCGPDVPRAVAGPGRGLALDQPGPEDQLRAAPAAPLHRRARLRPAAPGDGDDHLRHRRHPGRVRAGACRPSGAVLGGGLLPVRVRPVGRAGREARDERLRPVRALRAGRGQLGRPAHRDRRGRAGRGGPVRARRRSTASPSGRCSGPPDVEARTGLTGGHIFQGDCLPGPDVGPALRAADADARAVPVRGGHPSRRQRDRGERAQRGDGGARGHRSDGSRTSESR